MTTIAVYNRASVPLGLDLSALTAALQVYIDSYLVPAWNCPATLTLTDGPVSGSWGIVFLDDADSPGALAYHTTDDGFPLSKIFVRTVQQAGESLSVSVSHELAEMLVDPDCTLVAIRSNGDQVAYEVCDPCEETTFLVNGSQFSDFVLPAYFDDKNATGPFDFSQVLTSPFSLHAGGYQSICKSGIWSQVFGSLDKAARFAQEDRRGHRSEVRAEITRNRKI